MCDFLSKVCSWFEALVYISYYVSWKYSNIICFQVFNFFHGEILFSYLLFSFQFLQCVPWLTIFVCIRVALQFVHEMQKKSLESWDASKSQSLPVFSVGVAFVDESISSVIPSPEIDRIFKHIKLIVSSLVPGHKNLHIAPIEDVCSMGSDDGTTRLNELLNSVTDATGKEDFLDHLCMLSLQKVLILIACIYT